MLTTLALSMSLVSQSTVPTAQPAATLFPLTAVRLLPSPFTEAVKANRTYMLALDPDRLLAPFRREAGLTPKKPSYENWENIGLDGHTAGHYLSALADMIASGNDTGDQQLRRRLTYMVDELAECQQAAGDGYIGGVPGSKEFWRAVSEGHVELFWQKWVPWYNLHKTYAGLRDAYLVAGNRKARTVLINFGEWALHITEKLSDAQMQQMLAVEHGGMNEVFADIYAITRDARFLKLAERFNHQAILEPLEHEEDRLTGLHANTQIPKVIGFERIAQLSGDTAEDTAARFFWDTVTGKRSVTFGGNSVSEHFNDPKDFRRLLEHREGPETCNTYNMLRLTEQLFPYFPKATYADYYERALYNHILGSINPTHPGFVYFTPIRPGHYRVYSQPGQGFWCCVGTGMENPGRYGQFIYAQSKRGLYVNLFIPSQLTAAQFGLTLRQETRFPFQERTKLTLRLAKTRTFDLHLRHPNWVAGNVLNIRVNGNRVRLPSTPGTYATLRRQWRNGDRIEVELPMQTTVEGLPDGSNWVAVLRGPIVLAAPTSADHQDGLRAGAGRGDHIAYGPLMPLDQMPALLASREQIANHVVADPTAGPMAFRIRDVATPASPSGILLRPFFQLQDTRYQMYWELTSQEGIAERKAKLAAEERAKLARDAATLDAVAVGEQQPEVDHQMTGEGLETGIFDGRRWRHGRVIQYVLNSHGEKNIELAVTYSGGDAGRTFDISVNGVVLATESLKGDRPGSFFEKRYAIPAELLQSAPDGRLTIRFAAPTGLAGGLYDVRLMRQEAL